MDQWGYQERGGWTAVAEVVGPLNVTVRVPKTAELVADHFRAEIVSGALVEGEYLPAEAALTEAFGIARPTLREALRILETEGLIAVTRGARTGAKVLRPTIAPLVRSAAMLLRANRVTVADVLAARVAVESEAVRLLCAGSDTGLLAALHYRLATARRSLANGSVRDADALINDFAFLLVTGTGNAPLAMFAALVRNLLPAVQPARGGGDAAPPDRHRARVQAGLRAGEHLLALIAAGDAIAAAAHWRRHLGVVTADWLADGAGERVVELPQPR